MEAEYNGWWRMVRSPRHCLEDLVTAVCKYYKCEVPRLVVSRKKMSYEGDYADRVITLYAGMGDNPGVLLHELAHHLVDEFYPEAQNHGPEFCAIYMHLLDKWGFLPNEEFRRLAKKYKVRIGRRYRPKAFQ
jgi:hypothetical protein